MNGFKSIETYTNLNHTQKQLIIKIDVEWKKTLNKLLSYKRKQNIFQRFVQDDLLYPFCQIIEQMKCGTITTADFPSTYYNIGHLSINEQIIHLYFEAYFGPNYEQILDIFNSRNDDFKNEEMALIQAEKFMDDINNYKEDTLTKIYDRIMSVKQSIYFQKQQFKVFEKTILNLSDVKKLEEFIASQILPEK